MFSQLNGNDNNAVPTVFFELYFALYSYWNLVPTAVPATALSDFELKDFHW